MRTNAQAPGPRRHRARAAVAGAGLISLVAAGLTFAASSAVAADLPATFLDTGSQWRYSDDNTDPAAGSTDRLVWTGADFDDTAWKTGTGPFGAKNGQATGLGSGFPITTLLNQYIDATAATKVAVPTFHLRSGFDLTADQLGEVTALTGTVVYDDALQIFVNGTKVAGFLDERVEAVPDEQKNLVYAGVANGDPVTSTFTVPVEVLQPGTNTIAVGLYNDRASSSDVYLDVKSLAPVVEEPEAGSATVSDLVLGVGGTEAERNLAWYSDLDTEQVAQIAPAGNVVDGTFPADAVTVAATGGPTSSGEFNRFATFTGLEPNTAYSYRVGAEGAWSGVYTFRTQSFDGGFDFLFFGDPQLGSSGNVASDTQGWIATLDVATAAYPRAELLFSGGDQVEHAASELQYEAFLSTDYLRQIPFVATNGNHDVGNKAYSQHFNVPNLDVTAGPGSGSASGGDYWFVHKDVLFLNLNSNSRDFASHERFVRDTIAAHGDEAKWTVVAFHHSIYSTGPHATDSDVKDRRDVWPTLFSEVGVDLVLQGHDHSYARSYLIRNGEKADPAEQAGADILTPGPGGVLYVTANSASGSKYYAASNASSWWLSASNQENVRNYTAIEVSDDAIAVKTIRSQAKDADRPVNSVVDQVTITKPVSPETQKLQVVVPEGAPGELVWAVDGANPLVDLGTATAAGDHFAATGTLNPVRVTDTRRGTPSWSVSAQVGDFTGSHGTFSGKYLGWTPQVLTAGGGATAGAAVATGFGGGAGLSVSSVLGSAGAGHPTGSATLGADLDLVIPVDVTDGTYRATLTLTALS
ncbi:metallophosphoesterase [Xylanimonas cellulosilytica DSM 15894]|uniref:Metallophosphoesterase n=1 Tax=Xylanimonas cellulosilytica (strain DSM 15894 / JCM 12276 / CECT 5975 / KCTC 9989 / LMG 20990 / NBRC 107835 / XIL07) TaxID=446471 RepID=D1BXZ3_XYLCX|nr:metallophosphoesterase family protein [Xylanimonas cellulosilytica]ACZ31784.1 metallophosphoesterase [Xylanimonas cellulosilytica DSM 15894]